MAFNNASDVWETTQSQGTEDLVLDGAVVDGDVTYKAAIDAVGSGNSALWRVWDDADEEWFFGSVSESDDVVSLSRDTMVASTNGGSAVDWGPGTRNVICGLPPAIISGFFSNLLGNGIMVQTSAKASVRRSIAATTPITVTNGSGVDGNPTLGIALGAGLKTLANQLVAKLPVTAVATTTTVDVTHRAVLVNVTAAATVNFEAAATLGGDWFCAVRNSHNAAITLDPNGDETIDGAETVTLQAGETCFVACNGSALLTVGRTITPSGANVGTGSSVFHSVDGPTLQFRKVNGGTNITVTQNADDITLAMSGTLGQSQIASSAIGQSQLRTSTSEHSVTEGAAEATVAGGEYGFCLVARMNTSASNGQYQVTYPGGSLNSTYANRVRLLSSTPATLFVQQRYVTASPPYDWGDGPLAGFAFLKVEKGSGKVRAGWTAADPPWAYNGPTRTRADVFLDPFGIPIGLWEALGKGTSIIPAIRTRRTTETLAEARAGGRLTRHIDELAHGEEVFEAVTLERKMRDMAVLPQPFFGVDGSKEVVVMLDPLSDVTARLFEAGGLLEADGESILSLVHAGHIQFDNEDLAVKQKRGGPRGVMQIEPRFR